MQAQTAELHPAEQGLQRLARDAAGQQLFEPGGRVRRFDQEARLVFGEDASGSPKARDDLGIRFGHPAMLAGRADGIQYGRIQCGRIQYGWSARSRARCAALFATVAFWPATASGVSSRSL